MLGNDSLKDYFLSSTTMLSGLCGLVTLYIAILLYDRYGVESKNKEQIFNAIQNVISELQSISFSIRSKVEVKGECNDYFINMTFQTDKQKIIELLPEDVLSSTLYYKWSGMYACSHIVNKLQSDIFLPPPIVKALNKISVFYYEQINLQEQNKPFTTLMAFLENTDYKNDISIYIPKEGYTVIQFLDAYFGVKDAIIEWLESYDIDTKDLNLTFL